MSDKVFNTLRDHYQIPKNIPICLPRKFEKCYSERTADVGMYDAMFTTRLKLPLTELHHQLTKYLGLSVNQIAPNAWRIFIGAKVIWGQLSGGSHCLSLNEFFYCYKSQQISLLKGIYHFLARKTPLSWCQICLTPIEIRRIIISSSKGQIGFVGSRNGIVCPMVLITLVGL